MKFLTEVVQDTIRLTSHQKAIFATIAQAGTSVADDVLAGDANLSGALKQLVKMNMVSNANGDTYTMTSTGTKFATEAGVIDESGAITEEGAKFVIGSTVDKEVVESVGSFKDYLLLI